jgi:hypothetical protein
MNRTAIAVFQNRGRIRTQSPFDTGLNCAGSLRAGGPPVKDDATGIW